MSPIDGSDGGHLAVIRDVTERKRVEIAIMATREDADRAYLGKSRFLATASHDSRQSVQTLGLLNGILRRTVAEPHATEAFNQHEQAIGAMSRLLNALLDISKLESGVVEPEQADFSVALLFNRLMKNPVIEASDPL